MDPPSLKVPRDESWYILLPVFMKYGFKLAPPVVDNFLLYDGKTEILLPRKNHIPEIQIRYFINKSKIGHDKFLKCLASVKKEEQIRMQNIRSTKENPTIP